MGWLKFREDSNVAFGVKAWLVAGLIMIFFQIVIGGITRLTGSGLSITRWEIVTGSIPPLNETTWMDEFELYKSTPQYQKINQGMSLDEFKFIYFWEYFHRLWARLMFVVFVIGFTYFLIRGMFSKKLIPRLIWVVILAGIEGFFGWIMVASGLIKRPWVNAYNLTLHLCMALVIFSYLLWTAFIAFSPKSTSLSITKISKSSRHLGWIILVIVFVQIALGAMMSGSKAGLSYPTWPYMNGVFMPSILLDLSQWHLESFVNYDANSFMPTFIQFLHRNTAYILTALIIWLVGRNFRHSDSTIKYSMLSLLGMTLFQVFLGVVTIINCNATIPVDLGVYHQAGAVLLLSVILWVNYKLSSSIDFYKN